MRTKHPGSFATASARSLPSQDGNDDVDDESGGGSTGCLGRETAELCAHQAEYPELDFKRTIDLSSKKDIVEFAKDVGAMSVRGGFIVVGAHDDGKPSGALDVAAKQLFDEANLRPKLVKYLPPTLEIRTNTFEIGGGLVALIYVAPNPAGCAVMTGLGQYDKDGTSEVVFQPGDIFWRNGTQSVRISPQGFEEIVRRRVVAAREAWVAEQQELRRHEIEQLQTAYESRAVADAPIEALTIDLDTDTLIRTSLELARRGDTVALQHLVKDAAANVRAAVANDDFEQPVGVVVDKLVSLAGVFIDYELDEPLDRVIQAFSAIYSIGFKVAGELGQHRYGEANIDPSEKPPRLWLLLVERVYAFGALAVRVDRWDVVRRLSIEAPNGMEDYYQTWLRHSTVMANRAQQLTGEEGGRQISLSLLSLALAHVRRLPQLRLDGADGDDEILTSLVQFDVLSTLAAIAHKQDIAAAHQAHFGRFHDWRSEPIVQRLIQDADLRSVIFPLSDEDLAVALDRLNSDGVHVGWDYAGFHGFRKEITDWIDSHRPVSPESSAR